MEAGPNVKKLKTLKLVKKNLGFTSPKKECALCPVEMQSPPPYYVAAPITPARWVLKSMTMTTVTKSLWIIVSAVMDVETHTAKHEQQKCDHVYIHTHTPYTRAFFQTINGDEVISPFIIFAVFDVSFRRYKL